MKFAFLMVVLVLFAATGLARTAPTPSFTQDQARRGQLEFYESCAECHGAQARGHYGPALVGSDGNVQWYTLKYIYTYTLYQMPHGNPGGLSKNVYLDIMAFLLKQHGNKPGKKPLTDSVARTSSALFGPR